MRVQASLRGVSWQDTETHSLPCVHFCNETSPVASSCASALSSFASKPAAWPSRARAGIQEAASEHKSIKQANMGRGKTHEGGAASCQAALVLSSQRQVFLTFTHYTTRQACRSLNSAVEGSPMQSLQPRLIGHVADLLCMVLQPVLAGRDLNKGIDSDR